MDDKRGISLFHNKSFWTRVITGGIILLLLALIFIIGYDVMLIVLGRLALIGIWEIYRVKNLLWKPFAITGFIADICYYVLIRFYDWEYCSLYLVFLFAILVIADIIIFIAKYPEYTLADLTGSVFTVIYVGVLLSFLYLARVHAWGAYLVWLAMLASWGCDIFAYLGGMLFGKHKIFPAISPKKTLEGCISGIVGAGILAFIYALIVNSIVEDITHEVIIFPIVCMAGAVLGMFGDLFASAIKRQAGIKDYSNILPGHGGIMDRFDSVILVSPVIYAATILMRIWH